MTIEERADKLLDRMKLTGGTQNGSLFGIYNSDIVLQIIRLTLLWSEELDKEIENARREQ